MCVAGSSPRGRGTRRSDEPLSPIRRFIPARAGNTRPTTASPPPRPVHPRAGGEHEDPVRHQPRIFGSSPRGRGTRRHPCYHLLHQRFIPARAGNTQSCPPHTDGHSVHPRAGGEHADDAAIGWRIIGSSPRGRGTQAIETARARVLRFIPARAGNTRTCSCRRPCATVHPRAGGEHPASAASAIAAAGSSPRGRGTPNTLASVRIHRRFIPARAGNTWSSSGVSTRTSVHPRAGGEHHRAVPSRSPQKGSSPRGRGTHLGRGGEGPRRRFIPARAGNTVDHLVEHDRDTVHPRAGGEHREGLIVERVTAGSSPRGRGTQEQGGVQRVPDRFIPARAGNTPAPRTPPDWKPVHPRAGGEHENRASLAGDPFGSSPRGRGTLRRVSPRTSSVRFIPARAGNTLIQPIACGAWTVHPRAGGEHPRVVEAHAASFGSSPRGRGTHPPMIGITRCPRFIPARAGNTPCTPIAPPHTTVHPRAGGEHGVPLRSRPGSGGSSPRGRGTLFSQPIDQACLSQ